MLARPAFGRFRNPLWSTIAFGLLGLATNLVFPIVLFDHVQLLPGGVFYFFITALWGPWYGALAAGLASLGTPPTLDWVSPLLAIAEAFAVGLLYRRKFEPVQMDLLYWAVAGTPLLFLTHTVDAGSETMFWTAILKYPFNSVLAIIIVESMLGMVSFRRFFLGSSEELARLPLRTRLFHSFVILTTIPFLVLAVLQGRSVASRYRVEEMSRLQEAGKAIQHDIDLYLD